MCKVLVYDPIPETSLFQVSRRLQPFPDLWKEVKMKDIYFQVHVGTINLKHLNMVISEQCLAIK